MLGHLIYQTQLHVIVTAYRWRPPKDIAAYRGTASFRTTYDLSSNRTDLLRQRAQRVDLAYLLALPAHVDLLAPPQRVDLLVPPPQQADLVALVDHHAN
jgi:hypothetical protein